jgi:restriction system protein
MLGEIVNVPRCGAVRSEWSDFRKDGRDSNRLGREWRVMTATEVPQYHELLWPALQAVAELGGSASIGEIVETVIKREGFSDDQQAVLHNDGPETEIGYRLAWARTYLKAMGLLANSARGVWALTDDGTALLTDPAASDSQRRKRVRELWSAHLVELRKARKVKPSRDPESDAAELTEERGWKERLLEQLMSMAPDAFERLAQRLLREADFDSVNVTGKSGDGGIDGLGVYRLGLVSFPVFFQCKRYRGSVSPSAVRDFRGAMSGRGDKGLLITTGSFTADAKKEATRDGAPPIDLIDGDRLCDLLKRYDLGVRTTTRTVEDIDIDAAFFSEI